MKSHPPPPSRLRRILPPIAIIAVIVFVFYGLYLANRPVRAPLQGQFDARYIDVSAKISGRVGKLHVSEGDEVQPGAVLVSLDSPETEAKVSSARANQDGAAARQQLVDRGTRQEEVRGARADWERAASSARLAQATYKRMDALYREGLISQQHDEEVETAYRTAADTESAARARYEMSLNGFRHEERVAAAALTRAAAANVNEIGALALDVTLKAPISGEVDKVILHVGELASAGFPIMTLVNLADTWAVFNLREDEMDGVRIGTEISGTVPALGNKAVKLRVYYISPKGEYATWRATRQSSGYDIKTFEVRARPLDAVAGLRPGMSVLVAKT
jgi:HlyD family secretion protein